LKPRPRASYMSLATNMIKQHASTAKETWVEGYTYNMFDRKETMIEVSKLKSEKFCSRSAPDAKVTFATILTEHIGFAGYEFYVVNDK